MNQNESADFVETFLLEVGDAPAVEIGIVPRIMMLVSTGGCASPKLIEGKELPRAVSLIAGGK